MGQYLLLQLGQFPQVAAPTDLAVMHEPHTEATDAKSWFAQFIKPPYDNYYGYGWRIFEKDGKRIVFHGGLLAGFQCFIGLVPQERVGIVILNNSNSNFAFQTGINFLNDWKA